jgi:hypothetical protein
VHGKIHRVAEVQFSPVHPPLGENLKLDLNLEGYLVENREPEPQNWFYKVQSMVQAGSDLIKKEFLWNCQSSHWHLLHHGTSGMLCDT